MFISEEYSKMCDMINFYFIVYSRGKNYFLHTNYSVLYQIDYRKNLTSIEIILNKPENIFRRFLLVCNWVIEKFICLIFLRYLYS